jgi:hypothetical protein
LRLALALRDTRIKEQIERALSILLKGEQLNDVLTDKVPSENLGSAYFGNIGRCLWFQGNQIDALKCYAKSFAILKVERDADTTLNLGYACLWLFEALYAQDDVPNGLYFLKYCLINWEKVAPVKEISVRNEYNELLNSQEVIKVLSSKTNWDIEQLCSGYIAAFLKK